MALFITCKKEWLNSVWSKEKIGYLIKEANKKRISYHFFFSYEELLMYKEKYEEEDSSIVIITNLSKHFDELLDKYEDLPLNVIVFANHMHANLSSEYSYVMDDTANSMILSVELLKTKGCKHPCLVGLLSNGGQDRLKIESFKKHDYSNGNLIFDTESGRLVEAIEKLFNCDSLIDSVICSNDLQAIRLIKIFDLIDPKWNEKLLLVSYGNTKISFLSRPTITSATVGFEEGAKEVVKIHEKLIKDKDISAMHVVTRTKLFERESTNTFAPKGINFSKCKLPSLDDVNQIIEDGYKAEKIEKILIGATKIDYHILYGIMNKENQKEIAKKAHCSEGTIKYHLRQYKDIVGFKNTKEFIDILDRYIDSKKLAEYIKG